MGGLDRTDVGVREVVHLHLMIVPAIVSAKPKPKPAPVYYGIMATGHDRRHAHSAFVGRPGLTSKSTPVPPLPTPSLLAGGRAIYGIAHTRRQQLEFIGLPGIEER